MEVQQPQQEGSMESMLLQILQGQQQQFKQHEERMRRLELMLENGTNTDNGHTAMAHASTSRLLNDLSSRLSTFVFDPENNQTFSRWYDRYGEVFTTDGALLDDKSKVRLLVGKLSNDVFDRYSNQILPKTTSDIDFKETVATLKEMFNPKVSLFTSRYQCLKLEKMESEDYMEYTGRVNEQCEKANFQQLDSDGLKALLWIYGLKSSKDAELRQRLLLFLDNKNSKKETFTLHDLYNECDLWLNIKRESKMLETGARVVNEVRLSESSEDSDGSSDSTERLCWNCGRNGHISSNCRARKWKCSKCKGEGHKQEFCERARKFRTKTTRTETRVNNSVFVQSHGRGKEVNVVRRYLSVQVNGHDLEMQLDTGSDITLLNVKDWERMGRPKLERSKVQVSNASGHCMTVMGKMKCDFVINSEYGTGDVYVSNARSVCGLDWLTQNKKMSHYLSMMSDMCKPGELGTPSGKPPFDRKQRPPRPKVGRSYGERNVQYETKIVVKASSPTEVVEDKIRRSDPTGSSVMPSTRDKKWQKVTVDVVGPIEGNSFLVVEDESGSWPEVSLMEDIKAESTVCEMMDLFKRFDRMPETIVTKLNSQFTSKKFRMECEKVNLKLEYCSSSDSENGQKCVRFAENLQHELNQRRLAGKSLSQQDVNELRDAYFHSKGGGNGKFAKNCATSTPKLSSSVELDLLKDVLGENLLSEMKETQRKNEKKKKKRASCLSNEVFVV